jgi:hypothetical protein
MSRSVMACSTGSSQQIVDLTKTCGTCATLAMLLTMAQQSVPAGVDLPFKPGHP